VRPAQVGLCFAYPGMIGSPFFQAPLLSFAFDFVLSVFAYSIIAVDDLRRIPASGLPTLFGCRLLFPGFGACGYLPATCFIRGVFPSPTWVDGGPMPSPPVAVVISRPLLLLLTLTF